MQTKICSKCKIEKPISEFSIRRSRKDGYENQCKECIKETTRKRIEKRIYLNMKTKICIRCGLEKDIGEFTKNKISLDGYDYYCKECKHKKENEYYIDNATDRNQKVWEYHKGKQHTKEAHRRYRENHPDKIKAWEKENKKRRKEAMAQLPYTLTDQEWQECLEYFNHTCAYCNETEKLQREHFVSALKGGPFTKDNIIPSCPICNLKKGDKDFFMWYPKQAFYNKDKEEKILKYLGYLQEDK